MPLSGGFDVAAFVRSRAVYCRTKRTTGDLECASISLFVTRQAGAKPTTDFGACRDLQGRRLRHVNDEVRLQKWQENR